MKTSRLHGKNGRQLVLQHLEGVSGRILDECPELIRQIIRRRSGVYALYRRDKLYYVGLASNLMSRLTSHLRDRHRKVWDTISVTASTVVSGGHR